MSDWPQMPRLWPRTNIKWLNDLHQWLNTRLDMIEHRLAEARYTKHK